MMTNSVSTGINNRAEGSPGIQDAEEARSITKTTTMPPVRSASDNGAPAAETGVVQVVRADQEGREINEHQDAGRTDAETQVITQEALKAQDQTPTILIIEDSTELAEIIEATLQRLDMVTAHETHGNRALDRYDEMNPDVVLLDIGLPDTTGWKLLDDIRERKGDAPMPAVIIITAYGDPANRLIAKLQNVHDYLIKPFTSDEVERVVVSALSRS
jgi:CheY-like chemotaxis protein